MLEITDLAVWYPTSGIAMSDLDLSVPEGSVAVLTGRSGCGLTTILNAIGSDLPAGARRRGRIVLDDVDLSGANPDDLSAFTAVVRSDRPASFLRVADLLPPSPAGRHDDELTGLLTRLGVAEGLERRIDDAGPSVCLRAELAAALSRHPRLLLLDEPLGPVESRWRDKVAGLVREAADAGTLVVWAEHQLVDCLPVADTVTEITDAAATTTPAWRWRPRTVPSTPLQQVASVLDLVAPGADDPQWLRTRLLPLLGHGRRLPPTFHDRGESTLHLNSKQSLSVRDDEVLHVLCPDHDAATTTIRRLRRTNGVPPVTFGGHRRIADLCRATDRRRGTAPGVTWQEMRTALPTLRGDDLLAHHSAGERALVVAWLTSATGPVVALRSPAGLMDGWTAAQLMTHLTARTADCPVVLTTTNVEEAATAERVVVTDGRSVLADGRAGAIADSLPVLPKLAQACAPHRVMTAEEAVLSAGLIDTGPVWTEVPA